MIYKLLFMFCFIVQSIQGRRDNDKVTVQVYYETYDFNSRLLIATDLKEAVNLLDRNLVAVEMYAYGNTKTVEVDGKYEFTCENGPEECMGNKFDACAMYTLDRPQSAVNLITCIMDPYNGLNGEYDLTSYTKCSINEGIDTKNIHDCSKSEFASILLRRNGVATDLVAPKHLPFVLINGKEWNTDDNVSLFVVICEELQELGIITLNSCF